MAHLLCSWVTFTFIILSADLRSIYDFLGIYVFRFTRILAWVSTKTNKSKKLKHFEANILFQNAPTWGCVTRNWLSAQKCGQIWLTSLNQWKISLVHHISDAIHRRVLPNSENENITQTFYSVYQISCEWIVSPPTANISKFIAFKILGHFNIYLCFLTSKARGDNDVYLCWISSIFTTYHKATVLTRIASIFYEIHISSLDCVICWLLPVVTRHLSVD